jgi:predicted nuclease of predicted toxin-antitoxin system
LKILLDTCLSVQARDALRTAGHDVVWGGDWDEDPGDETIMALALKEARVLITLDKDFGELAVLQRIQHGGPAAGGLLGASASCPLPEDSQ